MNLTPPIDCLEVRSHVPLYVGADLEPPLQARVREHLAGCEACGRAVSDALEAREALVSVRGTETHRIDLWQDLRGQLADEGLLAGQPALSPGGSVLRSVRWSSRWLPLGVAAAAMLVAGLSLWGSLGPATTAPSTPGAPGEIVSSPAVEPGSGNASSLASSQTPGVPVTPVSGGLRPAGPEEARLWEEAQTFGAPQPGVQGGLWSLASERGLR